MSNEVRELLARRGVQSSRQLQEALGVGQATVSRLLRALGEEVVRIGRGRATLYALATKEAALARPIPVYRIGDDTREVATLRVLNADHYLLTSHVPEVETRVHAGLPRVLEHLRPEGYLGQAVAAHMAGESGWPPRVEDWSDRHVLRWALRHGWNVTGDLLVGKEALDAWVAWRPSAQDSYRAGDAADFFLRRAEKVLAEWTPGSSAGGMQPKFLVNRLEGEAIVPVLVKFSAPADSLSRRRRADLLVAEHLALETLREGGESASRSQLVEAGSRVFLEVERFDRVGSARRGVASLAGLLLERGFDLSAWPTAVRRLHEEGVVSAEVLRSVRRWHAFGRWIGNSDMHAWNLSFFCEGERIGGLTPVYDMLPMHWQPRAGELVDTPFDPQVPQLADIGERETALEAHALALRFWERVAQEERISADLQQIASRARSALEGLAPHLARLPASASSARSEG